jgi:hypothetical protein
MDSSSGLDVQDEYVDRAHSSGMMKFLERWSRKKVIDRRKKTIERKS